MPATFPATAAIVAVFGIDKRQDFVLGHVAVHSQEASLARSIRCTEHAFDIFLANHIRSLAKRNVGNFADKEAVLVESLQFL